MVLRPRPFCARVLHCGGCASCFFDGHPSNMSSLWPASLCSSPSLGLHPILAVRFALPSVRSAQPVSLLPFGWLLVAWPSVPALCLLRGHFLTPLGPTFSPFSLFAYMVAVIFRAVLFIFSFPLWHCPSIARFASFCSLPLVGRLLPCVVVFGALSIGCSWACVYLLGFLVARATTWFGVNSLPSFFFFHFHCLVSGVLFAFPRCYRSSVGFSRVLVCAFGLASSVSLPFCSSLFMVLISGVSFDAFCCSLSADLVRPFSLPVLRLPFPLLLLTDANFSRFCFACFFRVAALAFCFCSVFSFGSFSHLLFCY